VLASRKFIMKVVDRVAAHAKETREKGKEPDIQQLIWWQLGDGNNRQENFDAVQRELARRSAEKRRKEKSPILPV